MGCGTVCSLENASLNSSNPEDFTIGQWCKNNRLSLSYVIYRTSLAAFFLLVVVSHILITLDFKWFIFMTNQGIILLTAHYILDAFLVNRRYSQQKKEESFDPLTTEMTTSLKVSWLLNSSSFAIALWITTVYWSLLHPHVVASHFLKTQTDIIFNFILHAVNTMSTLLDTLLSKRPMKPLHFIYGVIFGLWYLFFSMSYWAVGGTGFCRTLCVGPDCIEECDSFIYPILDYGNKPGEAVGIILIGCLIIPICHLFYYGCHLARQRIHVKCRRRHEYNNERENSRQFPLL